MNIFVVLLLGSLTLSILVCAYFHLSFSLTLEQFDNASPFECGFSAITMTSSVFSLPFFIISIIFLLFDVEILILCFYPFFNISSLYLCIFFSFVVIIILGSTLFEWSNGILSWF